MLPRGLCSPESWHSTAPLESFSMAYWFPCNFVSPGVLVLHCSTGIYSTGVMVLPGILCSLESGAPLPHWTFAPLEPCSPGAPMPSGVLVLHCSTGALLPWSTAPRSLLESKCSLESHSPIVFTPLESWCSLESCAPWSPGTPLLNCYLAPLDSCAP